MRQQQDHRGEKIDANDAEHGDVRESRHADAQETQKTWKEKTVQQTIQIDATKPNSLRATINGCSNALPNTRKRGKKPSVSGHDQQTPSL